jgi:hypothetical protein
LMGSCAWVASARNRKHHAFRLDLKSQAKRTALVGGVHGGYVMVRNGYLMAQVIPELSGNMRLKVRYKEPGTGPFDRKKGGK